MGCVYGVGESEWLVAAEGPWGGSDTGSDTTAAEAAASAEAAETSETSEAA